MQNMQKVLRVTFKNEVSRDVGGISREFFTTIMKELLNESIGLFTLANTEQFSYKIAVDSYEIQGHEELFHFFGKLLGKAMFDRIPLNLCLNRSIFNALVGKISPEDYGVVKQFKHVDSEVANSLSYVLDQNLEEFGDAMEFYFTTTHEITYNEVELKQGGANLRVTDANKQEFARLKCHYHAYVACKKQLEQIRKGFYEVIPHSWIKFFSVDELETFMCGLQTIDLADWKMNTETRGFSNIIKSLTLYRFWQIMGTYD